MDKYLTIRLSDMDIPDKTDVAICMGIINPLGDIAIPEQVRE
jgi:hypothetical protein